MGNTPEAQSSFFVLDTKAPELSLSADYLVFSPNGDIRRDTVPSSWRLWGRTAGMP
jgi:hypothetical protein